MEINIPDITKVRNVKEAAAGVKEVEAKFFRDRLKNKILQTAADCIIKYAADGHATVGLWNNAGIDGSFTQKEADVSKHRTGIDVKPVWEGAADALKEKGYDARLETCFTDGTHRYYLNICW